MFMYPGCRMEAEVSFLLSIYKELVDREAVGKQKELMVGTLRGATQLAVAVAVVIAVWSVLGSGSWAGCGQRNRK